MTGGTTESATRLGPFAPAYRLISLALVSLITIIAFEAMAIGTAMPSAARDLDAVRSYGLAFSVLLTAQLLGIVFAGVWVDRSGPLPPLFAGQRCSPGARPCVRSRRAWPSSSRAGRSPASARA